MAESNLAIVDFEDDFINKFAKVAEAIQRNSADKGFWHNGQNRNPAEMIALMHSELSELLEVIRKKNDWRGEPCDKDIDITAAEEELADLVIRAMDFAHGFDLDLGRAILLKHEYNTGRAKMHGKQF